MEMEITGDPQRLFAALAAAQAQFPAVTKSHTAEVAPKGDRSGYRYRYADLADVLRTALPVLASNGLCVMQPVVARQQWLPERNAEFTEVRVQTILAHGESGCMVSTVLELSVDGARPQAVGSAITYARRYAITALLGIAAEEDDDGASASVRQEPPRRDDRGGASRQEPPRRQRPAPQRPEENREPRPQRPEPDPKPDPLLGAARKWFTAQKADVAGLTDEQLVARYVDEWTHTTRAELETAGVATEGMDRHELAAALRAQRAAAKATAHEPPQAAGPNPEPSGA